MDNTDNVRTGIYIHGLVDGYFALFHGNGPSWPILTY